MSERTKVPEFPEEPLRKDTARKIREMGAGDFNFPEDLGPNEHAPSRPAGATEGDVR